MLGSLTDHFSSSISTIVIPEFVKPVLESLSETKATVRNALTEAFPIVLTMYLQIVMLNVFYR